VSDEGVNAPEYGNHGDDEEDEDEGGCYQVCFEVAVDEVSLFFCFVSRLWKTE
jgi:hypothetical protein